MSLRTIIYCALGAILLYITFTTGFPFLLAMFFAIMLEPLVGGLMRYAKLGRTLAATIACLLFTLLAAGFLYLVGFKMVSELVQFAKDAPTYFNDATQFFEDTTAKTQLFYDALPQGIADQLKGWVAAGIDSLSENLKTIVSAISGYFVGVAKTIPNLFIFFVVFLVALYLISFSLPNLLTSFLGLFDEGSRTKVLTVLTDLRRAVLGFLAAQFIISLLTYIVTLAGLLILDVSYPLAIALLIVVVDVLPVLGVSAVLFPWAAYSLLSGNSHLGIGLLVLFLVILIFRRIVEPKIIGNAVGINPLAALISMYMGFKFLGVVGLILGPILIIVYQALRRVGILDFRIKLDS